MRRWPARILICLILGAVTTVGMAWALALTTPTVDGAESFGVWPGGTERPRWTILASRDPGALDISALAEELSWPRGSSIDEFQLPGWSRAAHPPTRREGEVNAFFIEHARGWPMLSLYRRETVSLVAASTSHTEWGWELEVARHFTKYHQSRTLPLAVIWPGFLIDALFYGVLWLGLILGFSATKRALGTRRGLCPLCKYDLRGNPEEGCPECGWNRAEAEE